MNLTTRCTCCQEKECTWHWTEPNNLNGLLFVSGKSQNKQDCLLIIVCPLQRILRTDFGYWRRKIHFHLSSWITKGTNLLLTLMFNPHSYTSPCTQRMAKSLIEGSHPKLTNRMKNLKWLKISVLKMSQEQPGKNNMAVLSIFNNWNFKSIQYFLGTSSSFLKYRLFTFKMIIETYTTVFLR